MLTPRPWAGAARAASSYGLFWKELDRAVVGMGFTSVYRKFSLPYWFMMSLAYVCDFIGMIIGVKLKLNPFSVKMLTMHRWFRIDAAEQDLKFAPIIPYELGWAETITWFRCARARPPVGVLLGTRSRRPPPCASLASHRRREFWLPNFDVKAGGYAGKIAKQTQKKIDTQAKTK